MRLLKQKLPFLIWFDLKTSASLSQDDNIANYDTDCFRMHSYFHLMNIIHIVLLIAKK